VSSVLASSQTITWSTRSVKDAGRRESVAASVLAAL
jgi:hypothetical protein